MGVLLFTSLLHMPRTRTRPLTHPDPDSEQTKSAEPSLQQRHMEKQPLPSFMAFATRCRMHLCDGEPQQLQAVWVLPTACRRRKACSLTCILISMHQLQEESSNLQVQHDASSAERQKAAGTAASTCHGAGTAASASQGSVRRPGSLHWGVAHETLQNPSFMPADAVRCCRGGAAWRAGLPARPASAAACPPRH